MEYNALGLEDGLTAFMSHGTPFSRETQGHQHRLLTAITDEIVDSTLSASVGL